jgi:sterol desaturase/sphingolipid hydroxylase (fatty acid hydroxylase superfamily)
MTSAQIIVLATPVFLALIALEFWIGVRRGRDTYRLNDALSSMGLGIMSQLVAVFSAVVTLGLYTLVFNTFAPLPWAVDSAWSWLFALLLYDLCYYWKHRFGHTVALMWAAHVVHHQSEDYNLSTALRQSSSDSLLGWLFYLPLALLGVPPLMFGVVALIDLLYQYWVHTQQIGKLGGFDRWFCSPSNHRVHHAVNQRYLDKNYGGILIVWDRLFGSFADEDPAEPCVYGTRAPLRSWNPLWANLHTYRDLLVDAWHARAWSDKARVFFMHPGWRPADVAKAWPKPEFAIESLRRHDPPLTHRDAAVASLLFGAALGATALFLWHAHRLGLAQQLLAAGGIVLGLCGVGWFSVSGRAQRAPPEESPQ